MKQLIYILLIVLVVTSGCKKTLEETAYSSTYTKDFYSNAAEAEAAITAVYGNLYGMYNSGAPFFASDWSADQTFPRNVVPGVLENFRQLGVQFFIVEPTVWVTRSPSPDNQKALARNRPALLLK